MSKVIGVMVLVLAFVGVVFPSSTLAQRADGSRGEEYRQYDGATTKQYLVTYMNSQTVAAIRSATVVTVTNQSGGTCVIKVDWFRGFLSTPDCTTTFTLGDELTADFCSRAIPDPITACNTTCDPELTLNEGRAVVSSTTAAADLPDCAKIGVSARVYYTTGEDDGAVTAVTDSKIVKVGQGNRGD